MVEFKPTTLGNVRTKRVPECLPDDLFQSLLYGLSTVTPWGGRRGALMSWQWRRGHPDGVAAVFRAPVEGHGADLLDDGCCRCCGHHRHRGRRRRNHPEWPGVAADDDDDDKVLVALQPCSCRASVKAGRSRTGTGGGGGPRREDQPMPRTVIFHCRWTLTRSSWNGGRGPEILSGFPGRPGRGVVPEAQGPRESSNHCDTKHSSIEKAHHVFEAKPPQKRLLIPLDPRTGRRSFPLPGPFGSRCSRFDDKGLIMAEFRRTHSSRLHEVLLG